uniref:motile sperm domain-containing protein 1 isoform X2 n=1 Tax=Myxine glutinosa TaxID=7769 RepID=UPI00358EC4EB
MLRGSRGRWRWGEGTGAPGSLPPSPERRAGNVAGEAGGRLPVFVFPTELVFYADDQASHKQVLTLYNPYDFPLCFKVLCTAPSRYNVAEAEGTVRAQCRVDIVIRHRAVTSAHINLHDTFRLIIGEQGPGRTEGRREISALLLPSAHSQPLQQGPPSLPLALESSSAEGRKSRVGTTGERSRGTRPRSDSGEIFYDYPQGHRGPNCLFVFAGLLCVLALMLPTQGDSNSSVPPCLHLTTHQKLVAAYILGIVTMLILPV